MRRVLALLIDLLALIALESQTGCRKSARSAENPSRKTDNIRSCVRATRTCQAVKDFNRRQEQRARVIAALHLTG